MWTFPVRGLIQHVCTVQYELNVKYIFLYKAYLKKAQVHFDCILLIAEDLFFSLQDVHMTHWVRDVWGCALLSWSLRIVAVLLTGFVYEVMPPEVRHVKHSELSV